MSNEQNKVNNLSQPLRMVDTKVSWEIGDELINAVITAAVWSEGQRPGIWQKMLKAAKQGADKTEKGTVNEFFFRAMVSRLLEEYYDLDT